MIEEGLELSKRIIGAHNTNGFCGATVTGRRGVGKSSYSLRVAYEIYVHLGYTPNNAWRKALSVLKFEIKDVIDFLKASAQAPEQEYLLVWDDVGCFASSSMYFTDFHLVQSLKSVMDTIRTSCNGLILTTPGQSGMLGLLKQYDDLLIEVRHTARGGSYRSAYAYQFRTLPSGKRLCKKKFVDAFSVRLPTWVYIEYNQMRKDANIRGVQHLEEIIKKDD